MATATMDVTVRLRRRWILTALGLVIGMVPHRWRLAAVRAALRLTPADVHADGRHIGRQRMSCDLDDDHGLVVRRADGRHPPWV